MRRAIATAEFFGQPTIDARLAEVSRPLGTVLSLFMASRCPGLDAHSFWAHLRNPDAWFVQRSEAIRLG